MSDYILLLLASHFIGDFAFQPLYFVENKGKSWEVNFYHAATYTAAFIVFAHISWGAAFVLCLSHFIIDPLKARYHIIPVNKIWIDQILHFLVIGLIVWLRI
jgi:hypothetical protein